MMNEEFHSRTSPTGRFPPNQTKFDFIYTAAVSNLDIEKARDIISNHKEYKEVELLYGVMEGIEPFLNVSDSHLRITYPPVFATIEWEDIEKGIAKLKIMMERIIRLQASGLLCLRIQITSQQSLQPNDIVAVTRAERDHLQIFYEGNNQNESNDIFQVFRTDVEQLLINLAEGGLDCEWLDQGAKWENGDWKKSRPILVGKRFEYPYVLTSMKMIDYEDESVEKVVEEHALEFGSILRAVKGTYASRRFLDRLVSRQANISTDTRAFLALYARTCLFVYGSRKEHPGEETDIGIIDTVEILRMRWHGLIIANVLLGRSINGLLKEYKEMVTEFSRESRKFLATTLSNIIQLRIDVAELLEDPITYRRATGHLSELYEQGLKSLRIEELQNLALLKLAQLDRLYESVAELKRGKELESLYKDWVEVREKRRDQET